MTTSGKFSKNVKINFQIRLQYEFSEIGQLIALEWKK